VEGSYDDGGDEPFARHWVTRWPKKEASKSVRSMLEGAVKVVETRP